MAEEHVRALLAAGFEPKRVLVVGRRRERAEALAARHGAAAAWGGAEALAAVPPLAVVAVPEPELASAAVALVERGARHVLLEKPGALDATALTALERDGRAAVYVAYNRRFYASVARARELVEEDGGPLAVWFEFTELEQRVLADAERRELAPEVLARWGAANSLHVIDLAFHLAGDPIELHASRAGRLDWHPDGAVFAGSGTTARGALFAYGAAWSGAGRWSIELVTARRKLVLSPLESLRQQLRGGFAVEDVALPDDPDGLKPGLAGQLDAFLAAARGAEPDSRLCPLAEARARLELAAKLLGYA